jgi:hypothetical protein
MPGFATTGLTHLRPIPLPSAAAWAQPVGSSLRNDELDAFWKERVSRYASANRELAGTVESIDLFTRVRAANKRNGIGGV